MKPFLADCNTGCGLFGANSAVSIKTENRKVIFNTCFRSRGRFFSLLFANVFSCFHRPFFLQMLASLKKKKKETVKGGLQVSATISNGGGFLGWELSRVPSGPDPLHHNGGNPKKPRAL